MTKSIHPMTTHLGFPKSTPHTDHWLMIVEVDNVHRWSMRCITCDKHIKWATEVEYLWLNWRQGKYTKRMCKFRTMFWAPRYDETYKALKVQLQQEKSNEMISLEEEGLL